MSSRVGWEWTRWRRLWTKSRKRRRRRRMVNDVSGVGGLRIIYVGMWAI
jgi:hypothetical protein